jgi:type VI secretion system secreted protein VgrG
MSIDWQTYARELFEDATRLYRLNGDGELSQLAVEAWSLKEALSTPWELQVSALSPRADLDIHAMLGRRLDLHTRLADGREHRRSGLVFNVRAAEADGGLARYRLVVKPWPALMAGSLRSRVWQDRPLIDIVESVFDAYAVYAAWRWADDIAAHLEAAPHAGVRPYTVQFRETDLAFVTRLLAEAGIAWRIEPDDAAPVGHRLVLFADSARDSSCPEDVTSASALGGLGIRFHRAGAVEAQDAIQAFAAQRRLPQATHTVLAWDGVGKRALGVEMPTAATYGGPHAPRLEGYEHGTNFATLADVDRAARLLQEDEEARHKRWFGRGTVRTFGPGSTFALTGSPLDALEALGADDTQCRFLLTEVVHAGINNLPKALGAEVAREALPDWVDDELRRQAAEGGYANRFEAIRAHVPWRPVGDDDARLHPHPTAPGMLLATVVGPDGQDAPEPGREIHTDRLGRVRIRFHFQLQDQGPATTRASIWVRVLRSFAGAGIGVQFTPRIGQEVLVDFLDGDIERPVVVATLYHGRGEGGVPATPGGRAASADTAVFDHGSDHRPSGQGNTTDGHGPAWHGAAEDAHGHAGALSGIKTREFGGTGHNQLVFDDSDAQLRVQLATTQHGTQLNLGHLVHQADNRRGSFRGEGFELRTDAAGAVRAGRGLLLTTYTLQPGEPAGDNAAGLALAKQMLHLAEVMSGAADTHQTVRLAGVVGSVKAGQSALDPQAAPLKALQRVLGSMVDARDELQAAADTAERHPAGDDRVPHTGEPVLAVTARAGLAIVAGQAVQLAAGEGITLASGEDMQWAVGGAARVHAGQAIGVLGGAVKPGEQAAGTGLTMIAAQGDVQMQAQSGRMQVAAKDQVVVQSANAHIDWAAAKKITLATAGGASVVIEGGNITVQCPGTLTVKAGMKSFAGPQQASYAMPVMPRAPLPVETPFKFDLRLSDAAGPLGAGLPNAPWRIVVARDERLARMAPDALLSGRSSADGRIQLSTAEELALKQAGEQHPGQIWLVQRGKVKPLWLTPQRHDWTDLQRQAHALDALGYSDALGATGQPQTDDAIARLSREETEARSGTAFLNTIKN